MTDLDATTAREILGLRRRIETRAAGAIIRRGSPRDAARLSTLLDGMRRAAGNGDLWAVICADAEFHGTLFALAGLPAMEPILARCILHTHRFRLWAPWHRRSLISTADRHLPIVAALEAGDSRALRRELDTHLDTIVDTPR